VGLQIFIHCSLLSLVRCIWTNVVFENCSLLGSDTERSDRSLFKFRINLLPPSSGFGSQFFRNVGKNISLRDQEGVSFIITAVKTSNYIFFVHNLIIWIYGKIIPYMISFITRNLLFFCGSSCIWILWKSVLWEPLKLFCCCLKRIKERRVRPVRDVSFRNRRKEILLRNLFKMRVSVSRIRNLTWTYWT
jgi:hypothetical protein